jgi:Glycosyltransferase family 87
MRRPAPWGAAAASCILLAFSFYALQRWLERPLITDVPVYEQYATLVRSGAVPYRDFAFEYPPAALPALLLPAYMSWSYATSFAVLMGVCGAGCIACVAAALRTVGASAVRGTGAVLLLGFSPLVLGSLFDTRFDLWPTLLAVAAAATLVRGKPLATGALLGLGFAAKLWPGVLLPIAVVHLWRRRGAAAAVYAFAAFLAVAVACFLPFALLAPHGLRESITGQFGRPLQVESLGAAILLVAQHLGLRPLATVTTHGAQALSGRGAGLAADLSTAAELLAVVAVWIAFARRRAADGETALAACAAAVAALVAFDKVLSPQYVIWLVPFVLLVRGVRGALATGLLFVALGLTQTWFPGHYWQLALLQASPWTWYLLARDLVLVALAAVLAWELRAPSGRDFAPGTTGWRAVPRAAA